MSNAQQSSETLTSCGAGLRLSGRSIGNFSPAELRALLRAHRWLVFGDPATTEREVEATLSGLGKLVHNDRRRGAVLDLQGSERDQVLLGSGFMPLHRDGALMGNHIAVVGIYCRRYRNVTRGGRTFITDVRAACRHVSRSTLELIRAHGIEARPVDRYYTAAVDSWHRIPGFIDVEGEDILNVGLPYRADEKPSWLVRIPGVTESTSEAVFEELQVALMAPEFCYYHAWSEGDLVLLDNLRTLHGREAFRAGERALSNLQVCAA